MSSSLARMLRHAGFQLAAMSGEKEEWWHFSRRRAIPRMLRRMSRLAAGLFALDLELETDGVQLRVGRASRRLFIPAPGDAPTVKEGLEPFLRELDAALADCGVEHGFRVFSEKEWFGCFVQLLPRDVEAPWFFDASSISLDDARSARLPRIARLSEIVPRGRLYASDFKCPARPSDIVGLIDDVVSFARLEGLTTALAETFDGRAFDVAVEDGEFVSRTRIDNNKYVDLRPLLPLLGEALARRASPYRLHRCFGDGFEDVIARAKPEEARRLEALQFFVNPYEIVVPYPDEPR